MKSLRAAHYTKRGRISVPCSCGARLTVPDTMTGRTCRYCRRFVFVYWFDGNLSEVEVDE